MKFKIIFLAFCFQNIFLLNLELLCKPKLAEFSKILKYSQFGEEGVIEKIFNTIGTHSKVCIEFGAWDGFHLSNTANLWSQHGWKGILIEGDKEKFKLLKEKTRFYNCIPICAFVGNEPHNSLEFLLNSNSIHEKAIDLLSIDIDGKDYYIFESLVNLRPRVIICEFNPTMPPHLVIYQKYEHNYTGCSIGALVDLAERKGYKLISIVGVNCFFVINEEYEKFNSFETSFNNLIADSQFGQSLLRYLITSYDGKYMVVGTGNFLSNFGLNSQYQGSFNGNINQFPQIKIKLESKNVVKGPNPS